METANLTEEPFLVRAVYRLVSFFLISLPWKLHDEMAFF
jgi:hypothetical protein